MFRLFTLFTCLLLVSPGVRSATMDLIQSEFFTVTPSDIWAYWLLFLVPAGLAFSPIKGDKNVNNMLWAIVGLLCILLIGLRFHVGGDWNNYLGYLDMARPIDFSFTDALEVSWGNALGYMFINWVAVQTGWEIYFVNTFCATIFIVGLVKYCRKQPFPWIALAVAMPYMVCAVAMGYTRQATALGFFLWGLSFLRAGNEHKYFALIVLGSFFHLSIIITLPIMLLTRENISRRGYLLFGFFLV